MLPFSPLLLASVRNSNYLELELQLIGPVRNAQWMSLPVDSWTSTVRRTNPTSRPWWLRVSWGWFCSVRVSSWWASTGNGKSNLKSRVCFGKSTATKSRDTSTRRLYRLQVRWVGCETDTFTFELIYLLFLLRLAVPYSFYLKSIKSLHFSALICSDTLVDKINKRWNQRRLWWNECTKYIKSKFKVITSKTQISRRKQLTKVQFYSSFVH